MGPKGRTEYRAAFVMAAAGVLSSGVTTVITNACLVGTSIWDKKLRAKRSRNATVRFGAKAIATSNILLGRCVPTIVQIKPNRFANLGATRTLAACSNETPKKMNPRLREEAEYLVVK
jgi:hypothetical protein